MKKLVCIAILMAVFGCKTKTVTVDKTVEKEKESLSRYFDSLFKQSLNIQLDYQKQKLLLSDNLKLSSISQLDSSGDRKPFHYKYYVDGKIKEEIYLEGGEINKQSDSKKSEETERKDEKKSENLRIEVDVGQKKEGEKSTFNKNKKAKTTGFQFGFYMWLFLIVIVLIILNWVAKRLKLPDKLKALLGYKEGVKKPSDI